MNDIKSIDINGNKYNCAGIFDEDFAQNGQKLYLKKYNLRVDTPKKT